MGISTNYYRVIYELIFYLYNFL